MFGLAAGRVRHMLAGTLAFPLEIGEARPGRRLRMSSSFTSRPTKGRSQRTSPSAKEGSTVSTDMIPFNRASFVGGETENVIEAIRRGHISGDGPFTAKCHELLQEVVGVKRALLTTSCTHALEMSALLLDIQPGDEVIVPSFTFVSTVNAFVLRGARPVFIDIRPDTLNLDEKLLEQKINPRTRAIVVVHYAGVACEMDDILRVAATHQIPVVEDNAHGFLGQYRGRMLGTLGCMSTLSFHETKNFTSGEGGALLLNDDRYLERAEIIREKGTNRSRFFRGQVDKYSWVDIGSSYLPSELLAAFLHAQLQGRVEVQLKRQYIWSYYLEHLRQWAETNDVRLPTVPQHCQQPYHLFYLILPSLDDRQALIKHLKDNGIMAVFHYLPLHLSEMGLRYGGEQGSCPVTEDLSDRLLRLPLFTALTAADLERIVGTVRRFAVAAR
jgi:dTDP-4-amino-4,6-dideoxygalactose transaminase